MKLTKVSKVCCVECTMNKIKVGIIGCGLIGDRRAQAVVDHPQSQLIGVYDLNPEQGKRTAEKYSCQLFSSWQSLIQQADMDVIMVASPNKFLAEIALPALEQGKHVFIEKPMGRNLIEAKNLVATVKRQQRLLKVGFNHRYHPALAQAYKLIKAGKVGEIINIRAHYGHGWRPGGEKEWRANADLAGGGELTDQGVHLLDLATWLLGLPKTVFAMMQTAVWPIKPLEDNAFVLMQYKNEVVVNFHCSLTQWKNAFNFSVFGSQGAVCVDGLGGSYGVEKLTVMRRRPEGGVPDIQVEEYPQDQSWRLEWNDFMAGILEQQSYWGNSEDGLAI